MKLAQIGDEQAINQIINDPDIRPFIFHGTDRLDVTGLIGDSFFLFDDAGVFMADAVAVGEFCVLSAFKKSARGTKAVISHRKALDILFFSIGAKRVWATIDPENHVAIRNVLGLGFTTTQIGNKVIADIDYMTWALKTKTFAEVGKKLTDDPSVAKMLGAFWASVKDGWDGLALEMFNKFAVLMGIEHIMPADELQPIFKYNGKLIKISDNGFEEAG